MTLDVDAHSAAKSDTATPHALRKHWYEGSCLHIFREDVVSGVMSDDAEPHMHACRRTQVRGRGPQ